MGDARRVRRRRSWLLPVMTLVALTGATVSGWMASRSSRAPAPAASAPSTFSFRQPPLLPGAFSAVPRARVLDTRSGVGAARLPLAARSTLTLTLADKAGVPAALARAVTLQVSATASRATGAITVYPDGAALPRVPTLWLGGGSTVTGVVTVELGADGKVRFFNATRSSVRLTADVLGYYLTGSPTLPGTYASVATRTLFDSAAGLNTHRAPLAPHASLDIAVGGRAGVPAVGVGAVALQLRVESAQAAGTIGVVPSGTDEPALAYAGHGRGAVTAFVVTRIGRGGHVRFTNDSAGAVRLQAAVVGYFRAGPVVAVGAFRAVRPATVLSAADGPVPARGPRTVTLDGEDGVPDAAAEAVVLRVAIPAPGRAGALSLYAHGGARAGGQLGFVPRQTAVATVVTTPGPAGRIDIYNSAAAPVRVDVQVLGYYLDGSPAEAAAAFPTAVSSDHRYLLDQYGRPYLMQGDSPHSANVRLTPSEMATYLADRRRRGFNTVLVQVIAGAYAGNPRADFATVDGIAPFLRAGDIGTPNPAYFARLKRFVAIAEKDGIEVMLGPADTGQLVLKSRFLARNGIVKDRAYGEFLGRTFADFPNVMWQSGNDFQSDHWAAAARFVEAVAEGVRATAPRQLQSAELGYPVSTSFDDPSWRGLLDIDAAYTYAPTYAEVLKAYDAADTHPVYMTEGNYEYESLWGARELPSVLRREEYWTMTSGATGQLYGSHYTWNAGWADEVAHLGSPGAVEFGWVRRLFESLRWWTLVPDQQHRFVTSGYGRFDSTVGNILDSDYVTAAYDPSGSAGVAYLPDATTVRVNLALMHGRVTARWYDPTTGQFRSIGTFAPVGARTFTPPGAHRDGYDDWVLVLNA